MKKCKMCPAAPALATNKFLYTMLVAAFAFNTPALAADYRFTELSLATDGLSNRAVAINNQGQVVGSTSFSAACFGCGGTTSATIWNGTTVTTVGGSAHTSASDINDAGQVVGTESARTTSNSDAFLWDTAAGTYVNLSSKYYNDWAAAINNLGQVAGDANSSYPSYGPTAVVWDVTAGATSYLGYGSAAAINDAGQVAGTIGGNAVVWNGTAATVLGSLGGDASVVTAINNAGTVVGRSLSRSLSTGGTFHATLWNGTTPIDLGTLNGYTSEANGINNLGQVVGQYTSAAGAHAFLWDGTTMTDLNSFLDLSTVSEGWVLVDAQDINDKGQIVGNAYNSISGLSRGYVLTPVPEAETYSMLLAGLGLVGFMARRRKQVEG